MALRQKSEYREAYVFAPSPVGEPVLAGVVKLTALGSEFTYADSWYDAAWAYALDPVNLPLSPKTYRSGGRKPVFGVLSDAAPDSWGERIMLLKHNSAPRNEIERLLRLSGAGVGGVQFSLSRSTVKPPLSLPAMGLLDELSSAVANIEQKHNVSQDELRLLEPGSSMGGARPKLSLRQADGSAWLAKFSKADDVVSYPHLEYASMTLLAKAGLNVPPVQLRPLSNRQWCYLIQRFDKQPDTGLHFISANSLFNVDRLRGYQDAREDPASYVALARILRKFTAKPQQACDEWFARMLANIVLGNTDDHARNHALLFNVRDNHWSLSPVYDVVPIVNSQGLQSLSVGREGRQSRLSNAMSVIGEFGISLSKAMEIIDKQLQIFSGWRQHFADAGVPALDLQVIGNVLDDNLQRALKERETLG